MRKAIDLIKSLLFSLLLVSLVCNCTSKKEGNYSNNEISSVSTSTALLQVIDSVNQEINNGKYGLIDRFMIIMNEEILANFKYSNDYGSIAKNYDTTDHQYNYNHPNWHPYYKRTCPLPNKRNHL